MGADQWLEAGSVAVISDLHLAAGNSVLDESNEDHVGGLTRFLDENEIKVDAFILLGDVFDLALATYEATVSRGKTLVDVLARYCRKIVYVPGNHDHHLWLMANEAAEIAQPFPQCPPGYAPRVERSYLDAFIARISPAVPFEVCYPNAYWRPAKGNGRTFVFHHGHFCEDTYTLVSDIYRDGFDGVTKDLNGIEAVNAGWVEMVWYHLGQGGVGFGGFVKSLENQIAAGQTKNLEDGIERLYQRKISPLVHQSMQEMAKRWWLPDRAGDWVAGEIDKRAPGWIAAAVRRAIGFHVESAAPGASALRNVGLDDWLAAHCKSYLALTANTRTDLGEDVALVFGHTHRFGVWPENRPSMFNDGGWIRNQATGQWPDAYLFHIDENATLRALQFGADGETLGKALYAASENAVRMPGGLRTVGSPTPEVRAI